MTQATQGIRWTIHDLEVLPQSEGTRSEIIAGELFMTRAPHYRHQQVIGKVFRQLDLWSENTGLGVAIITPGVIFADADSVIPDVVWVSYDRLAQIEDEAGHLTDAPELVVEVLSPGVQNQRRDREAKLKLYSIQGVREYWLCDRAIAQVEVYRRQNAQLQLTATLYPDDEITSPLLPGFAGAVRSFFPWLQ
ncbi:MAG: Uma2 family endonuclease [Spirulinaceae cyanobacterium]